jgi:hypothetical protein
MLKITKDISMNEIKWKTKKYHTDGTVSKSNRTTRVNNCKVFLDFQIMMSILSVMLCTYHAYLTDV